MELGETVCLPTRPRCGECPIAPHCRARQELPDPGAIPARRPTRAKPLVVASVVALTRRGRWLVLRRPSSGLLGGLWEFPGGKLRPGEPPIAGARRELREETGLTAGPLDELGLFRHEYSHFRVALHLFRSRSARGAPGPGETTPLGGVDRAPAAAVASRHAQDAPVPETIAGPG